MFSHDKGAQIGHGVTNVVVQESRINGILLMWVLGATCGEGPLNQLLSIHYSPLR